ncbi:MAG: cupin domain-containing protein [Planctomycetota bacterium]|jgi:mannose-6-phosphate isomerase-like protein (cupin superfamily)
MKKINLNEKFAAIDTFWKPGVIAELNGQHVRLARLKGAFVWHKHDHEDELFVVIKGRLRIEFRDHAEELGEGEIIVIPRGVEHRPVAEEEAHVMLFEPATTVNTGDTTCEMTVTDYESI